MEIIPKHYRWLAQVVGAIFSLVLALVVVLWIVPAIRAAYQLDAAFKRSSFILTRVGPQSACESISEWVANWCGVPIHRLKKYDIARIYSLEDLRAVSETARWAGCRQITITLQPSITAVMFRNEWTPLLKKIGHIEMLSVRGGNPHDAILESLTSIQFEGMNVGEEDSTPSGFVNIKRLFPGLREVNAGIRRKERDSEEYTCGQFESLSQLPVCSLVTEDVEWTAAMAESLANVKKLQRLFVMGGVLGNEVLEKLRQIPSVKSIDLIDCSLDDDWANVIATGHTLESLSFTQDVTTAELIILREAVKEIAYSVNDFETFQNFPGFGGKTAVLTEGGLRSISDVANRQRIPVKSSWGSNGTVKLAKVAVGGPFSKDPDDVMQISFRSSGKRYDLKVAERQPLYVEGKGWVEAHEVQVGDRLRGKDGPTPEITAIERVPPEPTYVIRTEGNLPYFVSPPGADFTIWVP